MSITLLSKTMEDDGLPVMFDVCDPLARYKSKCSLGDIPNWKQVTLSWIKRPTNTFNAFLDSHARNHEPLLIVSPFDEPNREDQPVVNEWLNVDDSCHL